MLIAQVSTTTFVDKFPWILLTITIRCWIQSTGKTRTIRLKHVVDQLNLWNLLQD